MYSTYLGDSTESPQLIETIPKKGYKFIAETRLLISPPGALTPQSSIAEELPTAASQLPVQSTDLKTPLKVGRVSQLRMRATSFIYIPLRTL